MCLLRICIRSKVKRKRSHKWVTDSYLNRAPSWKRTCDSVINKFAYKSSILSFCVKLMLLCVVFKYWRSNKWHRIFFHLSIFRSQGIAGQSTTFFTYISITGRNPDLFHESLISAQDIATMISVYYAQEIWRVYIYIYINTIYHSVAIAERVKRLLPKSIFDHLARETDL